MCVGTWLPLDTSIRNVNFLENAALMLSEFLELSGYILRINIYGPLR
jgi:hypothetical protein